MATPKPGPLDGFSWAFPFLPNRAWRRPFLTHGHAEARGPVSANDEEGSSASAILSLGHANIETYTRRRPSAAWSW